MYRDCKNCIHKVNGACNVWECKFEPKEDEPFEPREDAISRQAVIQHICENKSCYKENCKGVLFNRCMDITWVNELPPFNPQPCEPVRNSDQLDCVNRQAVIDACDQSINLFEAVDRIKELPPVSSSEKPNINEVLDKIRAEIDSHCSDNRDRNDGLYIAMKIIDKYIEEGKA